MMTFACLAKQEGKLYPETIRDSNFSVIFNETSESSMYISNNPMEAKIIISMALTLAVGLFQVKFFRISNKFKPF